LEKKHAVLENIEKKKSEKKREIEKKS